jgi:methionyl-tRNA formyltransferase
MASLRLVFMGTPDFACPTLRALIAAGHEIAAVYTQPPRAAGRGMKERRSPVHELACAQGVPVRTPARLKDPAAQAEFAALAADAAIVVAYGLILPQPVLDAPRLGCFNLHASLLPRWRGAAPIQRAIMAGDSETGVCIMQMDAGLDTGPVLARESCPIGPDDTAGSLHDKLAGIGAALMADTLIARAEGRITAEPQPDTGITYADKISKHEARIDWTRPAAAIDCQIRGLTPFPGAWCEIMRHDKPVRIKILAARRADGSGAPGTALDARLTIACGEGALRIEQVQRAGKAPALAEDFLRGFPVPAGMVLP